MRDVDELYRKVRLRRYRKAWLAYLNDYDQPVGAVVAYRGPLGFNFSFLENRCDLMLIPDLNDEEFSLATLALIKQAASLYQDFTPQTIPLTCDPRAASILLNNGGKFIREYSQSMWVKAGNRLWHEHVANFYDRIEKIEQRKRRGITALESGEEPHPQ